MQKLHLPIIYYDGLTEYLLLNKDKLYDSIELNICFTILLGAFHP